MSSQQSQSGQSGQQLGQQLGQQSGQGPAQSQQSTAAAVQPGAPVRRLTDWASI